MMWSLSFQHNSCFPHYRNKLNVCSFQETDNFRHLSYTKIISLRSVYSFAKML